MAWFTKRCLFGTIAVSVTLFSLYYTTTVMNSNQISNTLKKTYSKIAKQSLPPVLKPAVLKPVLKPPVLKPAVLKPVLKPAVLKPPVLKPVLKLLTGCKPTKLLVGSKLDRCNSTSTVVTRTESSWLNEDDVCNLDTGDFVKTTLRSPAGDTPIYVYSREVDQWVSGNVLSQGIWERSGVDLLHHFMKKHVKADFVDLGANIGVYGLTFGKMGRRVILIDPLLGNVKRLCKSVRDGKFSNEVYVVHNAISDQRFKVGFGKYKSNVGGTFIKEKTSNEAEIAQAILLDDLLEIFNFSKVIMKIDVETHETRALLGGDKFFSTVDVIVVQLEWNAHKKDGNKIIKFLTKHNMKPYKPSLREEALDIASFDKWPGDILWKKV